MTRTMTSRQASTGALTTCIALLLCGCGSTGSTVTQTLYTPAPGKSQAAGSSGSIAYQAPKPWYQLGIRTLGFQSPTGNIRCALQSDDHSQLLCTTLNNGNASDLDVNAPADTNITAAIPAEPTVVYGHSWSSANFYCWSKFTGITCRSLYSTNGFEIDRDGITQLEWDAAVLNSVPHTASGSSAPSDSGSTSLSPDDTSSSTDFCSTHDCIGDWSDPGGYVVQCSDGTWSHSGGESGACSWHGGER